MHALVEFLLRIVRGRRKKNMPGHALDPLEIALEESVEQQIRYIASFYEQWDRELERRLADVLELDPKAKVGKLTPGNRQKLAIVLAVCHHPSILLLDEPLSALDPIARETMLVMLLERFQNDGATIVVSSHILRDVERIVDSVVCLDQGRVVAYEALDVLQERYSAVAGENLNLERIFPLLIGERPGAGV